MGNMYSGNTEKRIPRNLQECYASNDVIHNLWSWSSRLYSLGKVIAILSLVVGVVCCLAWLADVDNVIPIIIGLSLLVFALIVYLSCNTLALLIGSLASIVQHTKITADVALYHASCEENDGCDNYENNSQSEPPPKKYAHMEM